MEQWTPSHGIWDPLPVLLLGVQAKLVGIEEGQIHEYIQIQDKLDLDKDGEKSPLLLTTLDLS